MNKTKLLWLFAAAFLAALPAAAQTESGGTGNNAGIQKITAAFASKDRSRIADCFAFPYNRPYPLRTITNKIDFLALYDSIIDAELCEKIAKSSRADWQEIGWRGTALDNGLVWLDDNGKICALNYETAAGRAELAKAIEEDKQSLSSRYRNFRYPCAQWKAGGRIYRVDQLNTKKETYRLLILDAKSAAVLVELAEGSRKWDGSGGNYYYVWQDSRKKQHLIWVDVMGGSSCYALIDAGAEPADFDEKDIVQKF